MIKAVFFDLDGTALYNPIDKINSTSIYHRNLEALKKIQKLDVHLIPTTGRMHFDAKEITKNINCEYIISQNGNMVSSNDKIIYMNTLTENNFKNIFTLLKDSKCTFHIKSIEQMFSYNTEYLNLEKIKELKNYRWINFTNKDQFGTHDLISVSVTTNSIWNEVHQIESLILNNLTNFKHYKTSDECIDLSQHDICKYSGIKIVLEQMNINENQIIFVGDEMNDYEAILKLPNGFAMSNASHDVKKIAKLVITDFEEIYNYIIQQNELT